VKQGFGLLLVTIFWNSPLYGTATAKRIHAVMTAYEKSRDFSGAVLVADRKGVVYRGGFGWANRESGVRVTAATKFWIASVTKQFTAAGILQLAESGRLRLDGTIGDYLADYPPKHAGRITIEHLLTHTSGIPDYANREFMDSATAPTSTPARLLSHFRERELEFEPGSRMRYTNSGYVVLGAILERLTGKSWAAAMEEQIFGRLGMKDTRFDDLREVVPGRAAGYHLTYDGPENVRQWDRSAAYAAGGLRSTVDDLYRWDRAIYNGQVMGHSWVNEMFRARRRTMPAAGR
jgi:CubicO group peptidase (beta-lactamase class C family)